jgi:hypothetical protein
MDDITAIARARKFLRERGITTAPVDAWGLAQAEGFEVRESAKLADDEAGQTCVIGERRLIIVNKNDHPYRRRFTILHEVAHHVLALPSQHGSHLKSSELERYRSRPPEEILCDVFAAECLVPWTLIKPLSDEHEFTADAITSLSSQFEASKPCIASRFATASGAALAYVVAEDGIIKYPVCSSALRNAQIWMPKDVPLPRNSAAARAIATGNDHAVGETNGSDWSNSDAAERYSVREEAIYMPQWGQSLSLLTFEEDVPAPRATDRRSAEDEDLLPELTGYLAWGKRR